MNKSEKTLLKKTIVDKLNKKLVYTWCQDRPDSFLNFKKPIPVAEDTKFVYRGGSGNSRYIAKQPTEIVSIQRKYTGPGGYVVFLKDQIASAAKGWITDGLEWAASNELPLAAMPLELMQAIAETI